MKKNSIKENVLEGIAVRLTFDGSFQRANIYKKNISDKKRREFRKKMETFLSFTLKKILSRGKYTNKDHYAVLKKFADNITFEFSSILKGNSFRIGNAQKFLNLYWKVNWLIKKDVRKPIHCPFDSIIINKLDPSVKGIRWTKFDSIDDYDRLVKSAEKKAGEGKCLADWELEVYWDNRNMNNF